MICYCASCAQEVERFHGRLNVLLFYCRLNGFFRLGDGNVRLKLYSNNEKAHFYGFLIY